MNPNHKAFEGFQFLKREIPKAKEYIKLNPTLKLVKEDKPVWYPKKEWKEVWTLRKK